MQILPSRQQMAPPYRIRNEESIDVVYVGQFKFLDSRDSPVIGVSQILTIFLILMITHILFKFRNFLDSMLVLTQDLIKEHEH